jgi:UDP-N-acetylglucosamine acyltransferase
MASTHVAHDCLVGDNVIMSNLATLGGHVQIGNWAILGGGVLVHQFTQIGEHSLIGGGFRAVQDVPPFIIAANHPLEYKGVNIVGLKRRGFQKKDMDLIKEINKLKDENANLMKEKESYKKKKESLRRDMKQLVIQNKHNNEENERLKKLTEYLESQLENSEYKEVINYETT